MLTIVLLVVSFGRIQPPPLERAPNQPLDQPLLTAADSPAESLALPEYRVREVESGSQSSGETADPTPSSKATIVSAIAERYGLDMWPHTLDERARKRIKRSAPVTRTPHSARVRAPGARLRKGTRSNLSPRSSTWTRKIIVIANKLQRGAPLVVGTYLFVPGGRLPIPELIPGYATGRLVWPARGRRTDSYRPGHPGIDIAANHGVPILAADGGVVRSAFWNGNYGNQVVINHRNGFVTSYSHLSSFAVGAGQLVAKGSVIGYNGSTGYSTGPHLHFEVIRNGYYVNPLDFLR